MLTDVAVVIAEPVPAFELGVASEIFGLTHTDPELPSYRYAVCAERVEPVRTSSGFTITPSADLRRLDSADLVIVIGAAPPVPAPSELLTAALHRAVARGATVAALCTGAFVLAATGLLDGRRASTHWAYAADLARFHPPVTVDTDSIYVVDGPVATSAGSSAAIDLCVHLVRREHGADVANRVARQMVMPAHRSGGQAQYSRTAVESPQAGPGVAELLDWAADHLDDDLSVDALAVRARMSTRTFIRHFTAATGTTPANWVRDQRVRQAEQLLERADAPIATIARRCGFGSPDTLRRHFRRVRGVTPEAYRTAFRATSTAM